MKSRAPIVALALWFAAPFAANAQVTFAVGVSVPGIQLGIHLPAYPALRPIPGFPVYYAPYADANYFFYDGAYWLFANDGWYMSTWYDGPWQLVAPAYVPYFVLRVPVGYYRRPPPYFRGYRHDAPPLWGDRWGRGWEDQHRGWDRWDRRAATRPAPLPLYQRDYAGARYPRAEEQGALHSRRYDYRPSERATREHYERRGPPAGRVEERHDRGQHERRDGGRHDRGERERRGDHDRR